MSNSNIFVTGNTNVNFVELDSFIPKPNSVFVMDMEFGEQVRESGIVLSNDDGKLEGIRPRWAQVWRVGSNIDFVKEGQWICVDHGRWTRAVGGMVDGDKKYIRMVDNKDIFFVSDTKVTKFDELTLEDFNAQAK